MKGSPDRKTLRGWRARAGWLDWHIARDRRKLAALEAERAVVAARIDELAAEEPPGPKSDGSTFVGSSGGGEAEPHSAVESPPDPSPEAA